MMMEPVAVFRSPFSDKFGIPRQSGLVSDLPGEVHLLGEYRQPDALRGLEDFDYIWLIWGFSQAVKPEGKGWSATVRPPRLGGNARVGVFATRSPFRPNPIGLSCVKLEAVHADTQPVTLTVSGIDLLDGTPIYDIKPYIPVADCKPDAAEGYTAETRQHRLTVNFPQHLHDLLPPDKQDAAAALLAQDPRPGYADDPSRQYGLSFAGYDIRFFVDGSTLTVTEVIPLERKDHNGKNL